MSEMNLIKDRLLLYELVKQAYNFGNFKMKDGTNTNYYINGQVLTSNSESLYLCSKLILEEVYKLGADAVCGEVSGACPLVGSILTLSQLVGRPLQGYYIRKELKENGINGYMDITPEKGMKVVVVDDVLSSGKTVMRCKEIIEAQQGQVIGFAGIIDRVRGASAKLAGMGIVCSTIYTINDFDDYIKEQLRIVC